MTPRSMPYSYGVLTRPASLPLMPLHYLLGNREIQQEDLASELEPLNLCPSNGPSTSGVDILRRNGAISLSYALACANSA
jgi:hypothetical protein